MRLKPRRRWEFIGLGTIIAIVVGLWLLDRTLETILKGQIDAYLRARTLKMVQAREGKAIDIEIPDLDLSLIRRRLVLRNVRIQYKKEEGGRTQQFDAATPRITITGVDLTDAIWHRNFRLAGVSITTPRLYHLDDGPPDTTTRAKAPADTIPLTIPAADSLLYGVVAGWLPDEVRGGRIGSLQVDSATISSMLIRGPVVTVDSTAALSLTMRGLQLDSTRHRIFERATLSVGYFAHSKPGVEDSLVLSQGEVTISPDDTAFSIGEMHSGPPAYGHALHIVGVRRSHARQTLTIDSLSYAPPVADSTFFKVVKPRSTRVRLEVHGIKALGLRQENVRRRRLTAGGLWIGDVALDVIADRRVAGPPKVRVLWPEKLAAFDWVVGTDSAVVGSARIRYAEWPNGDTHPGYVIFDKLQVRLLHATNDSVVNHAEPLVIFGKGRLLGTGPFQTTIRTTVHPGPPEFTMEGEVGTMALTSFNTFLLPNMGLEITDGTMDRTSFRFSVANRKATGEIRPTWHDLSLRLVDPVTGKQNLGKKLKSVVARMISKDENAPEKDGTVKPFTIDYDVLPTDTFWGMVWRSLRSGLMKAMKN
jgi:hypothetical protein